MRLSRAHILTTLAALMGLTVPQGLDGEDLSPWVTSAGGQDAD